MAASGATKEQSKEKVKEPKRYNVIMFNDDFTTMDFVVSILIEIFHMNAISAETIMMSVHKSGKAKAGRKYELSKASPNVGFEIDGAYELLEADAACDYSAKFQSVIGTGRLSIIEDDEEKIKGLNALMNHISGKAKWDYSKEMVDAVAVFRLEVEKLSCKAK